jgi:23S rRNA (cytosine1962-C5)-methyltransferase
MIGQVDDAARPGDIVNVYDKAGVLFGRGLYHPRSQIALRMLAWGSATVDDAFWRDRLLLAVQLRRALGLDPLTDACRLVHAEGDGLSGLIAERYADCLVFELFALGMYQRRRLLADSLAAALGPPTSLDRPERASPAWRVVFRADSAIEQVEGFRVAPEDRGEAGPGLVTIREHGVRYRVDVAQGHKTGFFCDQRDNRRRFAGLCRDASVLDLCCYTAGFGLCARLLGGAGEVTCVDLDEAALAVARENVNLNNTRIHLVHSDAFIYLRQMLANGRTFDVVVLDPPKLVLRREEMDDGLRRYHDLNSLAMQVVRPGGLLLTCSCSGLVSREVFLDVVHRASRPARRTLQLFDQTGAAPDHPVMPNCPESSYLKALWFRVLDRG